MKGKLIELFNQDLPADDDFSHITKEVKKDKIVKENKNDTYLSDISQIILPNKHSLFFRKEKRRGKVVTMVGYFNLTQNDKKELLKDLKKSLACGGSIKEDFLEFQGELQERLKEELLKREFRFKK